MKSLNLFEDLIKIRNSNIKFYLYILFSGWSKDQLESEIRAVFLVHNIFMGKSLSFSSVLKGDHVLMTPLYSHDCM